MTTTEAMEKFATPGETKRKPAHVNRAVVGKMSDILNANGFSLRPDLEGAGYSVWQCGAPVEIEIRLFDNRFFRAISFEG
ncbi:MAG: hypothetical protein ACHQU0_03640, partial [Candidatus Paceibacteria bacterium]